MESRTRQIIDDRYVLQDALQTGGMTTVYKARDLESDVLVALKRFDRDRHLPEIERETYHREVESLRRLSHENIVRLINWGEDREGKVYLVLDLMKHDLVEERNLHGLAFSGWDDFADLVVLPLLRALAYAHEVGIAHRDVKPANVLVASDGTVKLADFGISKLKRTLQPRLTLSEFMSPPFSPPEADASGDTYARDVYAVGVLCLWALSNSSLQEHSDLASALDEFDAPPDVEALVRRSIALDPKQRFRSAALMATEIERIQAKRRQFWAETERKGCMLGITKRAFDAAMDELCTSDETEIRKFIGEDINLDSCIERFVEKPGSMDARIRAGHYSVIGTSFRYHVAESDRGHEGFALVNILRPEPHFLQRDREFAASSPIRFEFQALTGSLSKRDALKLIEQALEDFERKRREAERTDRKTALFDLWSRVLGAQLQFEREKSKPIAFLNSSVDGALATLHTEQETEGVEIGEPRFVESGDGRRIQGDVWDVSVGTIVLNCIGANLANFPSQGVAKLDLFAMQVALDRQNNAINRIRNGTNVAPRLRDLMTSPGSAALPTESPIVLVETATSLDESKREAVGKALAASDCLLVQGPPGTGKTQFLVALILETLRQKPDARVLLTSQTHIAIDNAIDRLGKHLAHGQILRIARDYSGRVQESAEPFLIDNQMGRWREEVQVAAANGLERWAEAKGLNPLDIRAGAYVGQIAALRRRLEAAREAIHDEDERRRGLSRMREMLPKAEWDCEVESVENHLQDLRDQLELDKKELGALEERLVKARPDGKSLLELSVDEQSQWAGVLLGDSPQETAAAHLIRLQGDWLDRFGAARGFVRPLIEKSSVTAATCVGVASIEEMEEVEFDLGIIDEASKATAMEACVPMSRCKRWILVGDSKQLPPFREEVLVRTELRERFDIQDDEASESLFERFRRMLPAECQTTLRKQYRMVEPVGRLISDCFYDGELESVNRQIDPILSSVTSRVVNWFTTCGLLSRFEQAAGTSFVNPEEAAGIIEILSDIDRAIGASTNPVSRSAMILSGYAAQANHLDKRTHNLQFRHLKIECCTIDRVQGREADIVLLSLTRSNAHRSAGFLGALERVNVALSRAREFLAIVGDDEFVEQTANAEGLRRVLAHIRSWPSECAVVNLAEYRRRRRPS